MATSAVCPNCSGAVTFYRLPASSCPHCTRPFPAALRAQIEAALMRSQSPQPGLLTLGTYGSLLAGGSLAILLALAPLDLATYSINGEQVSGREYLQQMGFATAVLAALCLAIGYGLWRERAWARPLMLWYWAASAFVMFLLNRGEGLGTAIFEAVFFAVVTMGVAGAYLYGSEAVNAYYRSLFFAEEARHRLDEHTPADRGA